MFFLELSSGLRRGELDVTEPKTKNSVRKVALSQQAVDLLVQEHEQHPDNPFLFPLPRTDSYWGPDAMSRINWKLLARAGIEEHGASMALDTHSQRWRSPAAWM